ncbi:uncharacterized protein LOC129259944 isoform X1 [Lytechinus pictus]|uniref:uncharacterized protein LOC129259944 isoform X1 n=1 Tax=Lytechinus pictus TaxID=7653 RepID=UPI0030BA2930
MAFGHCRCLVALVELLLLFAVLCLSLTAVATIVLIKNDFNGDCPLYPTIEDVGYFNIETNDVINCNYIIGANAVSAGISVIMMIYVGIELTMKKRLLSFVPILQTIISAILMIIVGTAAGVITVGFNKLCSGLELLVDLWHDYNTCKEWQDDDYWDIYDYDGSHFYFYLFSAQIATGISAGIWVAMLIISFIALVCYTSRSAEDDETLIL